MQYSTLVLLRLLQMWFCCVFNLVLFSCLGRWRACSWWLLSSFFYFLLPDASPPDGHDLVTYQSCLISGRGPLFFPSLVFPCYSFYFSEDLLHLPFPFFSLFLFLFSNVSGCLSYPVGWDGIALSTVIMREMAPGANGFLYIYFLYFFAHLGAISPMGAISRIPVR